MAITDVNLTLNDFRSILGKVNDMTKPLSRRELHAGVTFRTMTCRQNRKQP